MPSFEAYHPPTPEQIGREHSQPWSAETVSASTDASLDNHVFIRKLCATGGLSGYEKRALIEALEPATDYDGGMQIISSTDRPSALLMLLSGLACTHHGLAEQGRRILALHVPGDTMNSSDFLLWHTGYPVAAIAGCKVASLPFDRAEKLASRYPAILTAFTRQLGLECSTLRKWLEPRSPIEAIAHLYCELFMRYLAVGLAQIARPLELSMKQRDLADAIGLSLVHTNKSAKVLKSERLIDFRGAHRVLDFGRLAQRAGFDAGYLGGTSLARR